MRNTAARRGRPCGDHLAHRREIAAATWRLIDRQGLDAVRMRSIAGEAGCTTGVLAHYFSGRDEILAFTLEEALDRFRRTAAVDAAELPAREALRRMGAASLPLDAPRKLVWRVYLSFYGRALWQPELRRGMQQRGEPARRLVREILSRAAEAGELPPDLDVRATADLLVAQIDGIAIAALFDPKGFPPQRMTRLVEHSIDLLFANATGRTQ